MLAQRIWVLAFCMIWILAGAPARAADERLFVSNQYFTFGSADYNTVAVKLADLDGDGDLDAVVANGRHWARQDMVLLNNGNGRFLTGLPLGSELATSYEPALGDFNGDGHLDIVATRDRIPSQIFMGDGALGFNDNGPVGPTGPMRSIAAGDVNGDGALDLVFSARSAINHVAFGPDFLVIHSFGPALETVRVALGDLNGDGHLDAVFANLGSEGSVIYFGNAEGLYNEPTYLSSRYDLAVDVDIGDLNGDGHLDIALANIRVNVVFLNDGSGGFENTHAFGPADERSYGIDLGDLDGDGDLDIAVANDGQQNALYFNTGDGFERHVLEEDADARSYGVTLGDVDGNGYLDLIFANSGSISRVYLNVANDEEAEAALLR